MYLSGWVRINSVEGGEKSVDFYPISLSEDKKIPLERAEASLRMLESEDKRNWEIFIFEGKPLKTEEE